MTEKPKPEADEQEAERRFQETLGRLVITPHQPHKPIGAKPSRKAKPKD